MLLGSSKTVSESGLLKAARVENFFADIFFKLPAAFGNLLPWVLAAFVNAFYGPLAVFGQINGNEKVFHRNNLKFLNT
jgi:hypothetical protein